MRTLQQDANAFTGQKMAEAMDAGQTVALRLLCGVDLSAALAADGEEKARLIERIKRLIKRERLKGLRRHWSYDLNRHIALKQALDRLRGQDRIISGTTRANSTRTKTKRRRKAPLNCSLQTKTACVPHSVKNREIKRSLVSIGTAPE
jgi:hypothetical protein